MRWRIQVYLRWLLLAGISVVALSLALGGCSTRTTSSSRGGQADAHVQASSPEEAGRYLVKTGGCNDCHTPGWAESNGTLPESEWLVGNTVGFQGPWGTTYPPNLRLFVQNISEDAWVTMFRTRNERPPMPWMNYHNASEQDLRAIYRFIKSLGPKGQPAPAFVPPGEEPKNPYILWVPQQPKR